MGRRKIDISPIFDDRSRQVTFAKRKFGLLKKAYELSVLCECRIAVVVISRQNRVYEFGCPSLDAVLKEYRNNPGSDKAEQVTARSLGEILKTKRNSRGAERERGSVERQTMLDHLDTVSDGGEDAISLGRLSDDLLGDILVDIGTSKQEEIWDSRKNGREFPEGVLGVSSVDKPACSLSRTSEYIGLSNEREEAEGSSAFQETLQRSACSFEQKPKCSASADASRVAAHSTNGGTATLPTPGPHGHASTTWSNVRRPSLQESRDVTSIVEATDGVKEIPYDAKRLRSGLSTQDYALRQGCIDKNAQETGSTSTIFSPTPVPSSGGLWSVNDRSSFTGSWPNGSQTRYQVNTPTSWTTLAPSQSLFQGNFANLTHVSDRDWVGDLQQGTDTIGPAFQVQATATHPSWKTTMPPRWLSDHLLAQPSVAYGVDHILPHAWEVSL